MRNYHYYDGKYRDFVIRSLKHKGYKCIGNYIDTTIIISSHDRTYNFYGKSFFRSNDGYRQISFKEVLKLI